MKQTHSLDGTVMTKLLLRALAGEPVWPPPIWLMRQAGRYLPEYRALRAKAGDFIRLCTTPELASEVTLQPLSRFGMDAAILFSDILLLPWALGQELRFEAGGGPVLPPLRTREAVEALDPERLAQVMAPILETVRRVRAAVGEAALIGFAGGPFTVACYMVEGSGAKDFLATRAMAFQNPALFGQLMDLLTQCTITLLSAEIVAGAEAVMLFDSWAGILPPSLFRLHVIAPARRIVAALRTRHPGLPVIGFPRLAGLLLGEYARDSGVQAVGLDTAADPSLARAMVQCGTVLQGNLDPLALFAGGAALSEETAGILSAMRGWPFIFNLGHGIMPATPPEHVAELVRMVRAA
jgi:uroporphyrinogen decarboxylase